MLRESGERAIAAGLIHDAVRAKINLGDIFLNLARYPEAGEAYTDMVEFTARYHASGFEAAARERMVLILWLRGEWQDALAAKHTLDDAGLAATGLTRIWHAATLARMFSDLGQPARARALLEADLEAALRNDELQTVIPFLTQLARACALGGEAEAGRQAVEGMLQRMDAVSFFDGSCSPALLEILHWLATAEPASGASTAEACLDRLQRLTTQIQPADAEPSLAEARAVLAELRGDVSQASDSYAAAAAGWAVLGTPFSRARALAAQGRALSAAGRTEDARAAYRSALTVLEELLAQLVDPDYRTSFSLVGLLATVRSALSSEANG
jgi:tetratricopeptide (TPR) repeat protein